ncbi:MAG: hypothetical protein M1436_02915, partial [Acidobacteria bacterium]|nr:hypothetical protein [Acidobacteriota bacterium]
LLAGLLLTACGSVRIGRITQDPTRFRNRTVHVSGTVVTSFGALGTGGYQIQDGTGSIYVLSSTGVPSKGSRVTVHGTVINGATVFGRSIGTAIREQGHKVKW